MLKRQIYHTLTNREYNTQQNRAESKWTEQNIPQHTKRAIMTGYGERIRETVKSKKCEKRHTAHTFIFIQRNICNNNFSLPHGMLNNKYVCCVVLCRAVQWRSPLFIVSIFAVNRYSHFIVNIWSLACINVCTVYANVCEYLLFLHEQISLNQIFVPLLEYVYML